MPQSVRVSVVFYGWTPGSDLSLWADLLLGLKTLCGGEGSCLSLAQQKYLLEPPHMSTQLLTCHSSFLLGSI